MKIKDQLLKITFIVINLLAMVPFIYSQDVGATFCWHYKEIYGGHDYLYNQSIVKKGLPTDNTHWSNNVEWWENMVEEVDYSGIDFIALLSRGDSPNAPDKGNGNPKYITTLVNAMNTRGVNSFKLAIFDDCPNSWTANKNWDDSKGTVNSSTDPKFDCGAINNYKYIWDYNLKLAIQNIPDERRYKINGRMVLIFWSVKSTWMTNMGNGNLKKIIEHIRTQCQANFGFNPYIIVNRNWFDVDPTCNNPSVVDAVHNWFSSAGNTSWTNYLWNGIKTGVVIPGFGEPESPPFIDPNHGQTLINGLNRTVKDGASLTLCEGFTDAAESAAYWRSTDKTYYDYPNQRLNIVRSYTNKAYTNTLTVEAEACDFSTDLSTGNSGGAFRDGDLDIIKSTDVNGGWVVTNTQANEWMEWKELPLLTNTKFQLRYKSSAEASVKFSVDGASLPTISLPSTNNVWTTIDAGNYNCASNSSHTVRLMIISGTPEINFFKRIVDTVSGTEVTMTSAVKIYPNPLNQEVLSIDFGGLYISNAVVTIFNLSGQTVYQTKINNTTHVELDLSGILKKSSYIISVKSGQSVVIRKFVAM